MVCDEDSSSAVSSSTNDPQDRNLPHGSSSTNDPQDRKLPHGGCQHTNIICLASPMLKAYVLQDPMMNNLECCGKECPNQKKKCLDWPASDTGTMVHGCNNVYEGTSLCRYILCVDCFYKERVEPMGRTRRKAKAVNK